MNESTQTALPEGQGGTNRNKKEGENVSGQTPLLHPGMIIQICTGSGESKQSTRWRVFSPVPCSSGGYLGRQLSRGICQILFLLPAPLLQDPHKACGGVLDIPITVDCSQPTTMLRHTNKTRPCFRVC